MKNKKQIEDSVLLNAKQIIYIEIDVKHVDIKQDSLKQKVANNMGALSTLYLSRSKALKVWRAEVLKVPEPSNEELEELLADYLESRLYNCTVIDDDMIEIYGRCDDHVIGY